MSTTKYWYGSLIGSTSSAITALNADGFQYLELPEGSHSGAPRVYVRFKVDHIDIERDAILGSTGDNAYKFNIAAYKDTAGYEVYHVTQQ
jgi:hypothetical protein